MIHIKKINKEVVKPIPIKCLEKEEIKGYCLFPELYSNIFLVARKKSGKTSTIYKILKSCVGKHTKVHIFASTVYKDQNWIHIVDYLRKKKIEVDTFLSISGGGSNHLESILKNLKIENKEEIEKKEEEFPKPKSIRVDEEEEEDEKKKIPKEKKKSPEHIFVFDDIGTELQSKSIGQLLKTNRHFLSKVICSSQNLHDLKPESRKQLDYILIYGGMNNEKLQIIHNEIDLSTSFDMFLSLYKNATKEKYNFLYVDVRNEEFRKNFNYVYEL